MLSGKRIILGVTGGIAAYKAAFLLRAFQKAGAEVRVTMTPSATRFVGIETFASLSGYDVAVQIFPEDEPSRKNWIRHIEWGEWADLFVIAPCTANTLSKIAHGQADNMLTSTVLAARCPLLICPTMDGMMYEAPATRENLTTVQSFGYYIMEPEEGYLASGLEGKGRLPEAGDILERCSDLLSSDPGKKKVKELLSGKKVVVTAGPTREHIDPVRFISNPSSGKMGFSMAEAARNLGAEVLLIHGPVQIDIPGQIDTLEILDAEELFEAVREHARADVIIMAAAVSDFTPADYSTQKIKKNRGGNKSGLKLKPTRDILSWLGKNRQNGQVLIGFAMETENLIANASRKREEKNVDWIIANSLSEPDAGFQVDTNTVYLVGEGQNEKFSGPKKKISQELLERIFVQD